MRVVAYSGLKDAKRLTVRLPTFYNCGYMILNSKMLSDCMIYFTLVAKILNVIL